LHICAETFATGHLSADRQINPFPGCMFLVTNVLPQGPRSLSKTAWNVLSESPLGSKSEPPKPLTPEKLKEARGASPYLKPPAAKRPRAFFRIRSKSMREVIITAVRYNPILRGEVVVRLTYVVGEGPRPDIVRWFLVKEEGQRLQDTQSLIDGDDGKPTQ
jgi:hypothetical protein